jgi:hypothetical protein
MTSSKRSGSDPNSYLSWNRDYGQCQHAFRILSFQVMSKLFKSNIARRHDSGV